MIHHTADVQTKNIGNGTDIWQFCVILPGAVIGENVNICSGVFIENDVVVGNNVTIKSGVQLWDGARIGDDVFVGPNVTFTNDKYPRSKIYPQEFSSIAVRKGASVGANATLLPGIVIGEQALIAAGAVVTKDVPSKAVVAGNPARIVSYLGSDQKIPSIDESVFDHAREDEAKHFRIRKFEVHSDIRGSLIAADFASEIPFIPARAFMVFDVPSKHVRGQHAHKECEQFLVCASGSCSVLLDDGIHREVHILDSKAKGLYIPPLVWGEQYDYTHDAVLLVFASHAYDADDYVRDYEDFLGLKDGR